MVLIAALLFSDCTHQQIICDNPNAPTEQQKGCKTYEVLEPKATLWFITCLTLQAAQSRESCDLPPATTVRTQFQPQIHTQAQTQNCPAVNFSQAAIEAMSYSDSTTNLNYVLPLYRQADGSFTAEAFSQPANSNNTANINVPGTNAGSLAQAQIQFAACNGISQWTPKAHPAILADMPGTMSRDHIVTNLGGAAYAEIEVNNGIVVALDSQTTLGATTTTYSVAARGILTGDFNGDGKRDVAVVGADGTVSVLLGNGNGTLGSPKTSNAGKNPVAMTSLDFNRDGRPDLAVVNQGDNTVTILLANPDGSMRNAFTYPLPGSSPFQNDIVAADFDGDGIADVLVYSIQGFTLLHGKGDGSFQVLPQKTGYTPFYNPVFLAPGDFNKDGKMDVAAFNDDGTVAILLNADDGSFPTQKRYVVGTPLSSGLYSPTMFATDFNDDGNLDLVFGNGHPDAVAPGPQSTTVLFGNGDGTFQGAATATPVGLFPGVMTSADFNGDGRRDLVVAAETPTFGSGLYMLLGQSGGGFQAPTQIALPSGAGFIVSLTTADLNGDGKADLIAVDSPYGATGHVYTWIGKGDGTFQTPSSYPAGSQPTFVTVGDVNRDGLPDLVIAYGNVGLTTAGTSSVALMTGKSGGGFNSATQVPTGVNTLQVTLADVNGDGNLDLIAANLGIADTGYGGAQPGPGNVSVSLGNGTGTFQTPTAYTVGVNPTWVAVGDVNGDGQPDLVVGTASDTEADIGVLLATGAGKFQPASLTTVYSWPSRLLLADFDGDGKLDLAIVHLADDPPLTIWHGNGNGTFQEQQLLFAGDSPVDVVAADFGAGRLDLAVLNNPQSPYATVYGTVNLFRNLAPGSVVVPPSATHFTVSAPATATTAASFSFTVTALDANNNTVSGYTGTVHFTSTDPAAVVPSNATLTNGTGAFAATLKTAGSRTITATDTVIATITGTSAPIAVTAASVVPPAPVSVSPAGGSASSTTYTFTYTDPRGYKDLNVVNVLVNNFLDGRHACYLAYVISSSSLVLVDDGGDAGGPYAGSVALGTSAAIQNSQCSVTLVSALGSGNTLTLTLTISWTAGFAGDKIIQMAARDAAQNNSGWQPMGTVRAPGPAQTPISMAGMSPNQGSGAGSTPFTFNWSDIKGYGDMGVENILVNTALNGQQACYLAFSRPGNVLYLVNDAGTALLPAQSMAAAGSLSNSQCAVTWGASAVTASGNNLSLTLNIAFMGALSGNDVIYLASRDINEANSTDWHAMGTWTAPAP